MGHRPKRTIWISCLLLLFLLLGGLCLLRRETYRLNKNVRLVSLRIIRLEKLSGIRHRSYKMQFFKNHYKVYVLIPGLKEGWKELRAFRYEAGIETSTPGFSIAIDRGRIVSSQWPEGDREQGRELTLRFIDGKIPPKQNGILFLNNGKWRAF